jgi:hypothetical protein
MSNETGGHWYTKSGEPCYEINGRGTTLRDARKLSLVPSVTTVLNVVAKPALTNWLVIQGIMAALTGTRDGDESDEAYISRILADSKAQAKAAAETGSHIHDACERMSKGLTVPEQYLPHATAAHAELKRLFPDINDWIAEASFAHPLGFGGKIDLRSPSTGIIADYKSKDGDFSDGKKLAWDQNWQLGAYQVGSGFSPGHERGAAIFVSRTHPGCVASHVWSAEDMAKGWRTFEAALALWKCTANFDASF